MLGVVGREFRWFLRSWWCRGHGAAVLALLVIAILFRNDRTVIFWLAIGFFVGHTATSLRRYVIERRVRTKVLLTDHHVVVRPLPCNTCTHRLVFDPLPLTSIIDLRVGPMIGTPGH